MLALASCREPQGQKRSAVLLIVMPPHELAIGILKNPEARVLGILGHVACHVLADPYDELAVGALFDGVVQGEHHAFRARPANSQIGMPTGVPGTPR
ncbi:protein of unknown function [Methylorubrum extorquens DM4]|uniref:Uncharacterized protein n=1 Tax=Methylorubrum extorquens (strain DSM 6343 / CIP 106787 / DM4) TaxID=661410 RepID=C7CEL1_METED|nr:protein of unknown function [Methylorubrum extorquens DM4]